MKCRNQSVQPSSCCIILYAPHEDLHFIVGVKFRDLLQPADGFRFGRQRRSTELMRPWSQAQRSQPIRQSNGKASRSMISRGPAAGRGPMDVSDRTAMTWMSVMVARHKSSFDAHHGKKEKVAPGTTQYDACIGNFVRSSARYIAHHQLHRTDF